MTPDGYDRLVGAFDMLRHDIQVANWIDFADGLMVLPLRYDTILALVAAGFSLTWYKEFEYIRNVPRWVGSIKLTSSLLAIVKNLHHKDCYVTIERKPLARRKK